MEKRGFDAIMMEKSGDIQWDEREDCELVKLAQAGEREAFGELVRRHRAKMYRYARQYAPESFMAEDIVQEALIRAFLHLGKLLDASRFLPWVHRIVRNQAFTKLKSAPVEKEQVFSTLSHGGQHNEPDEWSRLDTILLRLHKHHESKSTDASLPEKRLIQKENLEVLAGIIRALKPRERQIFEAHFFKQLSPEEIAGLFQLSKANVYQLISRSRKKVVQHNIRLVVDSYIRTRRDLGKMNKNVLPYHETFAENMSWISAVDSMYRMIQYTEVPMSMAMVAGLSGQAFRIGIFPEQVHIAGPTAFNFSDVLRKGLENMGFAVRTVDGLKPELGDNASQLPPEQLTLNAMEKREVHEALPEALDLVHYSLDRGIPVMGWDLFFPEFGVIYGYDDFERHLYADVCGRKETLTYENLGRSVFEEIFVLSIRENKKLGLPKQLQNALNMAIDHYDGKESEIPPGCVKGLQAYDAWISAFEKGAAEPNGNAYNTAVYRDARHYAARFFQELALCPAFTNPAYEKLVPLFRTAEASYKAMAAHYDKLFQWFPFPDGGSPADKSTETVQHLVEIKKLETEALGVLRKIRDDLDEEG